MRATSRLMVLGVLAFAATGCGSDGPREIDRSPHEASPAAGGPAEIYPGLTTLRPSPTDPRPDRSRGGVIIDASTEQYVGGNARAQVWVGHQVPQMLEGRPAVDVCLYVEIGPDRVQGPTSCVSPGQFVTGGVAMSPQTNQEWVEVYLVPDGFGDVVVPGLERVTPNLYVGDTRGTGEPGRIVTGATGAFRLADDRFPSTG